MTHYEFMPIILGGEDINGPLGSENDGQGGFAGEEKNPILASATVK